MVLQRLSVNSFRCFRSPLEVGPFGEGLNLVYGPNESGKSSLAAALLRGMLDRHNTGGEKAKADMQPWGTNLTPQITVEFVSRGERYRLTKRMLSPERTAAHLARWGADSWQGVCEGKQADAWLRERLVAGAPGAGLSNPEQWGIVRFLWSLPSEAERTPKGERTMGGVPTAVADQLRAQLPTTGPSALDGWIARARMEREAYFAPKGQLVARSDLRDAEERLASIRRELMEVREERKTVDEAAQAADDMRVQLEAVEGEIQRREERVRELRGQELELALLQESERGARERLQRETDQVNSLRRRAQDYARRETEEKEAQAELDALATELATLRARQEAARQLLSEAEAGLQQARTEQVRALEVAERARRREDARALVARVRELERVLQAAEAVQEQLAVAEAQRRSLGKLPSEKRLQTIREIERQVQDLQAKRDAAALRVQVTLESSQRVRFTGTSGEEEHAGLEGETLEYASDGELTVHLPGIASLRVVTARSTIDELDAELGQRRAELTKELRAFDAPSSDSLAERRRSDAELAARIEGLRGELKALVGVHERIEALRTALGDARGQLRATLMALELDEEGLMALPPEDVAAFESAAARARQAEDEAETLRQGRQSEVQRAAERLADAETRAREARGRLDHASIAMKEILAGAEVADRAALDATLRAAEERVAACQAEVDRIVGELPPPEADPTRIRQSEERALESARTQLQEMSRKRAVLESKAASGAGLHEREGDLEAQEVDEARKLAEEQAKACAARLLSDLLDHHRKLATARQLPGLEARVTRILHAVTGRERPVQVDPGTLVPTVVREDGVEGFRVDWLSSGTREQLDLAARIAVAETYAETRGERFLMLLDDPLLYTDPLRHERMREVLRIAAERLQIIIFSSHDERYRGLIAPEFQFDLPTLRRAAG